MSRWTDTPASEGQAAKPSRLRRLLDGSRDALSGNGAAAAILVRTGIAIGAVALVAVGLMIQGRSDSERSAAVKMPSFTTVPTIRREPVGSAAPQQPVPGAGDPFFAPTASLPIGQSFLPRMRRGPEAFCEDLASLGFSGARWEPSQVFAAEWECAAPLKLEGSEASGAFLVARGRRTDAVGSLMLRLNPAGEEERRSLVNLAAGVRDAFAAETGLILPEEASRLLEGWAAGEVAGVGGRMRLVADRAKPESRVLNLSVEPRFAALPDYPCDERCFKAMRGLAKVAETREVKSAAL